MLNAIEAAISALHQSIPSASHQMCHGSYVGRVLATSGIEITGETITAEYPQEVRRLTGMCSEFPLLTRGSTIELDERKHIVTSVRKDPIGASISFGLSSPMDEIVATYTRAGTAIWSAAHLLAVESEVLDVAGENFAPTTTRAWFICISADEWYEQASEPQIGDTIKWVSGHVRVASVAKHDGLYVLTCRARR